MSAIVIDRVIANAYDIEDEISYKLSVFSLDRDAKWLAWFEQQFSLVAGADRQIGMVEFTKALHVKEVSAHEKASISLALEQSSEAEQTDGARLQPH